MNNDDTLEYYAARIAELQRDLAEKKAGNEGVHEGAEKDVQRFENEGEKV
jgi:hypothetical protein